MGSEMCIRDRQILSRTSQSASQTAPLLGEPLAKRSSVPKCQSLPSIGEVARRSRDGEVQAQKQRDERDDFYNTLLIIKDTVFLSIEKDTLFSEVMHEMQKTRPWAILAAGAAIQVLTGLPAAWGVFQRPVMEEYGLSEQGAGYAFGVLIAFFGIGCVIGGFLQDKQGPRFAALWGTGLLCGGFFAAAALPAEKGSAFFGVFSIPAGLGTAFLYPSIQSCAQKWYKGRKGLATGVIGGAVGLSGAFLTVFVRTALRGFGPVQGIRGAFWALGALTLPVCLAGSALLTDPPPEKPQPSRQGKAKAAPPLDLSPRQMLGTRQYWLCAGAVCFSTPAVLLLSLIHI